MAKSDCPCGSGQRYSECCKPLHKGAREAEDAVQLMRSRYAAYAMKEAAYLWKTLAPNHEDRQRPEAEVLKEIRHSASTFRYMGLNILDSRPPNAEGVAQVLFHARIFHDGRNVSFVERSEFIHAGTGWRYWRGTLKPISQITGDPSSLSIDTFRA